MARPARWKPPEALSAEEQQIVKRLKRVGRLFVFLREHRHELFDEPFREELDTMYADAPRGTPPKDPMLMGLVLLLQAYEGASDAVAVENAMFDRRWQLVLDCLGTERPPFSQGALVDFRRRLLAHDLDRRLLERTVELARTTGGFGHKALRVALDSAPLRGAGRVEDTYNLIAHAMEAVVDCAALSAGLRPEAVAQGAGLELYGEASIKASLDIDWSDEEAKADALQRILAEVETLRHWVTTNLPEPAEGDPSLKRALDLLAQAVEQDLEPDPERPGRSRIRQGVAKNRLISVTDPEMRHGRKSKSKSIEGFKKHVAVDLDNGLFLAVTVRPANQREHEAELELRCHVERLGTVHELHADRGYLPGRWLPEVHRGGGLAVSKPWMTTSARFTKADFVFDFERREVRCPAGQVTAIRERPSGRAASFLGKVCLACPLHDDCLPAGKRQGRQLNLHAHEELLQDLRRLSKTSEGRALQRQRVGVEHRLAHHCRRQGPRARYLGVRKNTFDCRRIAAVENLHVADRLAA